MGAHGGPEKCVEMMNAPTLGYKVTGMYYKMHANTVTCIFYFANPEDVPESLIAPNRPLSKCTDGDKLPPRPAMDDISTTVGSEGECFVRMAPDANDECQISLENLESTTRHDFTGYSDGRGGERVGGRTYFCAPGTHQGLGHYRTCTKCTTEGYGASGNALGGRCAN